MLLTDVKLEEHDHHNGCVTTGTYTSERDDGSSDPSPRNQVVTNKGNGVSSTPYHVIFDNGATVTSKPAQITAMESRKKANGEPWWDRYWSGEIPVPYVVLPSWHGVTAPSVTDKQKAYAVTQALARARQGASNLPILLKERKETLQMVANRIKSIQDGAIALQRRALRDYYNQSSKKGRKRVYDHYANLHLEYLFGWATSYDELSALLDTIERPVTTFIIGRGRYSDSENYLGGVIEPRSVVDTKTVWTPRCSDGRGQRRDIKVTTTASRVRKIVDKRRTRASVRYDVEVKVAASLNRYGFASSDAIFDAVPLSFLLNFSSNTQDYLAALNPMIGAKYVTGHVTTNNTRHDVVTAYGTSSFTGALVTSANSALSSFERVASRTEIIRMPLYNEPKPEWFLNNNLTWGKIVTGALIGIQQRNRVLNRLIKKKPFATRPKRNKRTGKYLPPINYDP